MSPRFLLLFLWWLAGSAFAAAPDSVAGFLYADHTLTVVRSNTAEALLLRPDGTYRGIYLVRTYGGHRVFAPRNDGTWSYRKTGENTAELVFDQVETRTLTFTAESRGTVSGAPSVPILFGSFTLTAPARRPALVNSSNRSFLAAGRTAITGVVLTEPFNAVLVRVVGPGLASFGVTEFLPAPVLRVYRGDGGSEILDTTNGAESLRRTQEQVGAFPLAAGSADAVALVILPAGAYTIHGSGAQAGDSGEVLIEAYIVR